MKQTICAQLQALQEKIDEEEFSYLLRRHAGKLSSQELRSHQIQMELNVLSLRCLRIHLQLDLIALGDRSAAGQLREDWSKLLASLEYLEDLSRHSPEILCQGLELILLLGPERRKQFLGQLELSVRWKLKTPQPLSPVFWDIGHNLIRFCLQAGYSQEAFRVAENLIALSEERNSDHPEQHREVVVNTFYCIADVDPRLTARLCGAQALYFENIADLYACHFFWLHALSVAHSEGEVPSIPLMERCHRFCLQVQGETSWLAARSGSIFHCYRLLVLHEADSEEYLWDMLQKIDAHFYPDMDETASFHTAVARAALLRWRSDRQTLHDLLPELLQHRQFCMTAGATIPNINLTLRLAENLLACYYLGEGDYLQALEHVKLALQATVLPGLEKFPSDALLYCNLLLCYTHLNDRSQMQSCIAKLEELEPQYRDNPAVCSQVRLMINTALQRTDPDALDAQESLKEIFRFYQKICSDAAFLSDPQNRSQILWILDLCSFVMGNHVAQQEDLQRIKTIVSRLTEVLGSQHLSDGVCCVVYLILAQAEYLLGSPQALEHLDQCLVYLESAPKSQEFRILVKRFAALVYSRSGRKDRALTLIQRILGQITDAWQKSVAYLNDQRMQQQLMYAQIPFRTCYALLRRILPAEQLYEQVLRFKDLPALAGRERNRLLRLAPVDGALRDEIFDLQDRLAAAEMNDSLRGTSTATDLAHRLEQLEAAFAAQFPQNLQFTPIHFRDVARKLPEGSAIVEYYFAAAETGPGEEEPLAVDVFVTTRRQGKVTLHYLCLDNGSEIDDRAVELIALLQDPEDDTATEQLEALSQALYGSLLAPVLPYLKGIRQLYLAPDFALCNLPFELLHADGIRLQDRFRICRIVCGRDLLFYDDASPAGDAFVLGDPNYDCAAGQLRSSSRRQQIPKEPVSSLPFSGIEASRVARRCGAAVCRGDAATKYALRDALPCRLIHIATHGVFDEDWDADALYASHLVFAGYNRWVSQQTESLLCGNGVLTADEISRMDLRQTELVVLSACQSGLGDASHGAAKGLLSAFAAAGVRWIVSHIWHANDFSSAILMDAFYEAYLGQGMEVPAALQQAKDYLRTVTISQLRLGGWFRLPPDSRIDPAFRAGLEDMETWPGYVRPFENPYFWGGFIAHKAR